MKPALSPALEAELDGIRKDPIGSIGLGRKVYLPYLPNRADGLMGSDDPAVTERLLAEARGDGDRGYRLAVAHVLGRRSDATVDAALIAMLDDPVLRATGAYLLGRVGYKGYPARTRDLDAVRAALRAHLDDPSTFDDPFHRRQFRTGDFVLAALVRVTGPEKFHIADAELAELIGLGLPEMSDDLRAELRAQARSTP